jgi:hypothetical protein
VECGVQRDWRREGTMRAERPVGPKTLLPSGQADDAVVVKNNIASAQPNGTVERCSAAAEEALDPSDDERVVAAYQRLAETTDDEYAQFLARSAWAFGALRPGVEFFGRLLNPCWRLVGDRQSTMPTRACDKTVVSPCDPPDVRGHR